MIHYRDMTIWELEQRIKAMREELHKRGVSTPEYVSVLTSGEWAELRKSIGELAMAMGNPAVEASGDQTIESQTIREALRRVKETVAAVRRIRDAGIDVEAPL